MTTSKSASGSEQLASALASGDGTLALAALEEIEEQPPSKFLAQILQGVLPKVNDPIIVFQIKRTLKIILCSLQGKAFDTSLDQLQELLQNPDKLDELAFAISTLNPTDSFLATDLLRSAKWQEFPAPILPTFCRFFKRFGGVMDVEALGGLSRYSDPTVLTAALSALEVVDPTNLQSLVTPLLDSPNPGIRAKAIQTLYRWDKASALKYFISMLFSKNITEQALAIHHADFFPFPEVAPHLLRLISQCDDPKLLIRIGRILKANAHQEMPYQLFWIFQGVKGPHKDLIKGLLIGIVRTLSERKIIEKTPEEFLKELKERVKKEEELKLRSAMSLDGVPAQEHPTPAKPSEDDPTRLKSGIFKAISVPEYHSIEEYEKLEITQRVQILAKLSAGEFAFFKTKVPHLLRTSDGKELASIIRVVGRFGGKRDAEFLRGCLSKDDPDVVCASIEALANLDSEYLSIFLPQLMQNKNGKVRMKATRAFIGIDSNQIKSLVSGLLYSSSPKQRTAALPISTLVDFSIVRGPLLMALAKEPLPELAEKIGLIIASNPDQELFSKVFRITKKASGPLLEIFKKLNLTLAEKLAVALGKTKTPEELLAAEEQTFKNEVIYSTPAPPPQVPGKIVSEKTRISHEGSKSSSGLKEMLTSDSQDAKEKRANLSIVVLILSGLGWLAMIIYLILSR